MNNDDIGERLWATQQDNYPGLSAQEFKGMKLLDRVNLMQQFKKKQPSLRGTQSNISDANNLFSKDQDKPIPEREDDGIHDNEEDNLSESFAREKANMGDLEINGKTVQKQRIRAMLSDGNYVDPLGHLANRARPVIPMA